MPSVTEENTAEEAIQAINSGLIPFVNSSENTRRKNTMNPRLVIRLIELRESLRSEYAVGQTLAEKLAEAVADEQYELAAQLRDELTRRESK